MALGYSWTTIDTSTISGGYGDYDFLLQVKLVSQNTTANTSTIDTRIAWSFPNEYYSYSSTGTTYYLTGMSGDGNAGTVNFEGSSGVCFTGQYTISHNDDGTLTDSASGWINFGGIGTSTGTMSGSFDLPTINRVSKISSSSQDIYPYGNTYTMTITRYVSTYTHTVRYIFGALNGTIATGVTTSCTWTPDRSMLQAIPNQTSNTHLRVYCDTYSGGTLIGTSYIDLTVKTSSDESSPQITVATVTEDTTDYGIADSETVAELSEKTIAVTANTQDYSSLISIKVTCGTQTKTYTPSGTVTSASTTFTMTNLDAGDYVITVRDGRGYTTSQTITTTFRNYSKPVITSASVNRTTPTGSEVTITASGTGYIGAVGNITNTLTATYKWKLASDGTYTDGAGTLTLTYSGTGTIDWTITANAMSEAFDYQSQYDIILTIADTMGASASSSAMRVMEGIPVWSYGKEHFDIYGELHMHDRDNLTNVLKITHSTVIPNVKTATVINNQTYSINATGVTEVTFSLPADFGTSLGCRLPLAWPLNHWATGDAQVTIARDYTITDGTGKLALHAGGTQNFNITVLLVYIANTNV